MAIDRRHHANRVGRHHYGMRKRHAEEKRRGDAHFTEARRRGAASLSPEEYGLEILTILPSSPRGMPARRLGGADIFRRRRRFRLAAFFLGFFSRAFRQHFFSIPPALLPCRSTRQRTHHHTRASTAFNIH